MNKEPNVWGIISSFLIMLGSALGYHFWQFSGLLCIIFTTFAFIILLLSLFDVGSFE